MYVKENVYALDKKVYDLFTKMCMLCVKNVYDLLLKHVCTENYVYVLEICTIYCWSYDLYNYYIFQIQGTVYQFCDNFIADAGLKQIFFS